MKMTSLRLWTIGSLAVAFALIIFGGTVVADLQIGKATSFILAAVAFVNAAVLLRRREPQSQPR
jgi:hypothetical protein